MEKNQLTYTTIIHSARNNLGLSNNEYIFCDTIYHLSNNPEYKYCIMSKEKLGEIIGVSKQAIHKLIIKMIELGLIEKEETLKGLKTTKKWYKNVILRDESTKFTDSKESLPLQSTKFTPMVKKVYSDSKESLHNNNIYNNINNNTNITKQSDDCDVNYFIDLFKDVNISFDRLFANKTQREAIKRLYKKIGAEKLENAINTLKITNQQKYAPKITTPYELEKNFTKLCFFISGKIKEKEKNKTVII